MTHWKRGNSLITVGGYIGHLLSETQEYRIEKNKWESLSELPDPVHGSSATILNGWLYNLGGEFQAKMFLMMNLNSGKKKWENIEVIDVEVEQLSRRDATVVRNKIVEFGEDRVFVLEDKEGSL